MSSVTENEVISIERDKSGSVPKYGSFTDNTKLIQPYRPRISFVFVKNHIRECEHGCRSSGQHYRKWRNTYDAFLARYYGDFCRLIQKGLDNKTKSFKVSFDEFVAFAYRNSSGFIHSNNNVI
jgi:hypothetical protein